MRKKCLAILLAAVLTVVAAMPVSAGAAEGDGSIRLLFSHDMHSYLESSQMIEDGRLREHGGAARLKTLIDANRDERTLVVDAGDFSMGTLFQAGYTTDAYELTMLGVLGYDAATLGNHEMDYGGYGFARMLNAARAGGGRLPAFVQANMVLEGELTDEQQAVARAMRDYGAQRYTIFEKNGLRIAVFGLLGCDGEKCAPTSGMEFADYIESARQTVAEIGDSADMIICLSHSGTEGDGLVGEDIELAKSVKGIDVIVSGHSHTAYAQPVMAGGTAIVSCGEYASYLGSVTLRRGADGAFAVSEYALLPVDAGVSEDAATAQLVESYKREIEAGYLAKYGGGLGFDSVVAHTDYDFPTVTQLYAEHGENTLGNLIADSYLYAVKQAGIEDIDVALVALGTIRSSFLQGDITVGEVFEACSLGMGGDGSAGHPLISAYITGRELKLLAELDASVGPMMSSVKMNYAGLSCTFNEQRMLLDRVIEIAIVRDDGTREPIEDERLYRVLCNKYASNMLGNLNGMSMGLLSITPKDADGAAIDDLSAYAVKDGGGSEIKEWAAIKDYLASFEKKDGVPQVGGAYRAPDGRKTKLSLGGFRAIENPGAATWVAFGAVILLLGIIAIVIVRIAIRRARLARREEKRRQMQDGRGAEQS